MPPYANEMDEAISCTECCEFCEYCLSSVDEDYLSLIIKAILTIPTIIIAGIIFG